MIWYLSPLTQTQNSKPVNPISAHFVTNLSWPSGQIYRAACANRYMTVFPAPLLGPDITTLVAITKEQPAATDCASLELVPEKKASTLQNSVIISAGC